MSIGRTVLNLAALTLVSGALVVYAVVNWIGTDLFEPDKQVTVVMPDAGGLAPDQQVTVRGYQVGVVDTLELTEDGVAISLDIEPEENVPERAVVQVLRRSPIGEQAIDFIPVAPGWEPDGDGSGRASVVPARVPVHADWQPAPHGATIHPVVAVLPSSVPAMLERAETLLVAVDGDDVGVVVRELAAAFDGRTDILRELNRATADLGETLVDGIPEFERLIDSSGPVLASLRDHRDALAESFTHAADVSRTLADNRSTLDSIVDDSRVALRQADALVRNERADVSCLVDDLLTLNEVFSQDEQLDQLARLLDLNRFFYGGFDAGTQWDPYRPGMIWARVNLLLFEEGAGEPEVPRRPTPATLPGAACQSPFGLGVNAVRQNDPPPQPPDPTSPGIDYAPLADEDDRPARRDPDDPPGRDTPPAAVGPSEPLPETGAHALVVLGALSLAAAAALRHRH